MKLKVFFTIFILAFVIVSVLIGSFYFIDKSFKNEDKNRLWEEFEKQYQREQDSIQNEFNLLKRERDSLITKYDSLSKIKTDAHIKKVNSYRYLSLDSNITILSRTLSEKNIAW